MTRFLVKLSLVSSLVLLAFVGTGCGNADDDVAVTCAPGTFRIVGSIDDMSIDVTQQAAGALDQINGGEFRSLSVPEFLPDTYADLDVMWPLLIPDGATSSATATLKMPTSPYPTDVFCAGAGTTVHIASDPNGQITFHLASLTSGDGCATPRRGTLDACSRNAPN